MHVSNGNKITQNLTEIKHETYSIIENMAITRNIREGNTIVTSFGKYYSKVLVSALLFSSTLSRFELLL